MWAAHLLRVLDPVLDVLLLVLGLVLASLLAYAMPHTPDEAQAAPSGTVTTQPAPVDPAP